MKKLLLSSLCFLICSIQIFAQSRTVTGKVTDKDDGSAIPGVSVKVLGTSIGVTTGADGKYSVTVPSSAKSLTFSFIGYTPITMPIVGLVVNAQMVVSTKQLSEVVVTALGISRQQKSLGYSVAQVKPADLVQQSEPDMLKSLDGTIAGVNISNTQGTPGAATLITIRGNSSFYGDSQPLIIVDGLPYSNDQVITTSQTANAGAYGSGINDLDQNDIASFTVLKGASAAALYGSRASNGVIIITTKSGSPSRNKKGMEVKFNSSVSIEKISNLPTLQNDYGTGSENQYAAANGSWGPAFTATPSAANGLTSVNGVTSIPVFPAYKAAYPNLFPSNGLMPYQAFPDNVASLFKTGVVYENSIQINGGDEKGAMALTASQTNHSGYVPNSGIQKSSVGIGGTSTLDNGLKITGNLSYSRSVQTGGIFGDPSNGSVTDASSFARSLFLARNWDIAGLPYEDPSGNTLSYNGVQYDNPRFSTANNSLTAITERVVANVRANYDLTKWANLSFALGSNVESVGNKEIINIGSTAASFTGQLTEENYRKQEIESTTLLTLNPKINDDFSLKAIAGFNYNQSTITDQADQGSIFIAPGIYTLKNTLTQAFLYDNYYRHRLMGLLGDVTLGYKDWAFIDVTGRQDASSTLPVNSRSYFYPSVSGSFVFSEALKLQNDVFDFGKLTASFAKVGHDAAPYVTGNTYAISPAFLSQPNGHISTTFNDPNLTPEFSKEYEIGTNLSFFHKRIGLDVALYNKNSYNLLAPLSTAPSTGYSGLYTNYGNINNKGIEVTLNLKPISVGGFTWDVAMTYTKHKGYVTALIDGVSRLPLNGVFANTLGTYAEPGLPFGYIRGTVDLRDASGNLLINPANGGMITNTQSPQMIGNPEPKYTTGMSNTFTYKGFVLTVHVDATIGGSLYSETILSELGRGVVQTTDNRSAEFIIPGVYANPNTGAPILDANGHEIANQTRISANDLYFSPASGTGETFAINTSTEWNIYDATVYRLREISLGYQVPKKLLKKLPIGSAVVSLTGRNLWFYAPGIPKYTNFDPEVGSYGGTNSRGIEEQAAPSAKRYGINLSVTF